MEIYQIPFAIFSIRPDAQFSVRETYESLEWFDETQTKPTEKEFNDAVTAWNAEYDAQSYVRTRATEYPNIGDQLDDLYHKGAFSAKMTATLKKVKDDNPKE